MDGTVITGIILVTLGVMATTPAVLAWSDGAALALRDVVPGALAQLCGCLVATRASYDVASVVLIATAWMAIAAAARPLLVPAHSTP